MTRGQSALTALLSLASLAACETSPPAPSVLPGPFVPTVATATPGLWDARDELAAWVDNGATTGPATMAGDGATAVIQVRVGEGAAALHGPDLEPGLSTVVSGRIRYRWLDAGTAGQLQLLLYFRPHQFEGRDLLTTLSRVGPFNFVEERSGAWLERRFTTSREGPFNVRYALLTIGRSGSSPLHGVFEIDWIALER